MSANRSANLAANPVVTGLGVVSPAGVGVGVYWSAVLANQQCVQAIPDFEGAGYPCVLGGLVPGFDEGSEVAGRLRVQTDRWTWHSFAAAGQALADSGYDPADYDPYATSVIMASGSGGNDFGQREIQALWARGSKAVGAYQSIAWFYAASTGQLSILHGAKGPSASMVSEAAGGLDSIGWARRALRRGGRAALVGGTEAGLSPYALVCQAAAGDLSPGRRPEDGYKPFDVRATGHVPGEGGSVLLLETAESAAERGAQRIYGSVAGYASTHDGHIGPDVGHEGLERAIGQAVSQAGLAPSDIDLIVADGAGEPTRDRAEARALHGALGAEAGRIPVSAPQGLTGRLMAGGSALGVTTALLAIRDGVVPAVGNLDTPAPDLGLDLVRDAPRRAEIRSVLVNARGKGGFNAAVVITAPPAAVAA